ncbi:hypothetical protein Tco_0946017, partial [Tanacetum coccineum]
YKWLCCIPIPAKSDSSPHAHTQALKVNHSTSRRLLLNKNVISQKAQVHVKFSNSNNHELPHHQRYSKSNKESSYEEIWFIGKDVPRDSAIDRMDSDMVLETLLKDNPTQTRRYAKEFLVQMRLSQMRLQDFIKVTNPFDVVCEEENLLENERPVLERTADVAPVGESASKKGKNVEGSSSGTVAAKESASKAAVAGRLSSVQAAGKKDGVSKKPVSKKGYLESSKTTISLSFASTQSHPLVSLRSGSPPSLMAKHIPSIIIAPVEDSVENPRQDRFYASMSMDPSVAKNIYHPEWELTNDFIMTKGPLSRIFIDHLATLDPFEVGAL